MNDDKYQEKWHKYKDQKASLVANRHTVRCNPPKQQGIDVGTRVQERQGQKRTGLVVASDRNINHDYPCWTVQYEYGTSTFVKSTMLKAIRDNHIFSWVVMEDCYPSDVVKPFLDHGVVGYNLSQFTEAEFHLESKTYRYPHLTLLQYLWPGKLMLHCSLQSFTWSPKPEDRPSQQSDVLGNSPKEGSRGKSQTVVKHLI